VFAAKEAESEKLRVESSTYVAAQRADAERQIAENKAQCMALTASAEAEAAERLSALRGYNEKMRSLQSMRALAQNKELSISGNSGDNVVAQLMASTHSAKVLGLPANLAS